MAQGMTDTPWYHRTIVRVVAGVLVGAAALLVLLGASPGVQLGSSDAATQAALRELVRLQVDSSFDGMHTIYDFSLTHTETIDEVVWDFGDGGSSGERSPVWVYRVPGEYSVTATVRSGSDAWIELESVRLQVAGDSLATLAGGPAQHVTLDRPGAMVALPVSALRVNAAAAPQGFTFEGQTNGLFVYTVDEVGFFRIEGETAGFGSGVCHLFVSPAPSVHTDRSDIDWYKTQYGTGLSNCGPTVAAMAVAWATGQRITVESVREFVGWRGNGAVGLAELQRFIGSRGVASDIVTVTEPRDIMDMIDRDHLVGVIYDMAGLAEVADPQDDLFGQYYTDFGGHYLAIKGYTVDRRYFVVYDPIPSDWSGNRVRYADGTSMLGRNRYYPVDEFFAAFRTRQVLEVRR